MINFPYIKKEKAAINGSFSAEISNGTWDLFGTYYDKNILKITISWNNRVPLKVRRIGICVIL